METAGFQHGYLQGEDHTEMPFAKSTRACVCGCVVDSGIHGLRQSTRLVLGSFTPDCPLPF